MSDPSDPGFVFRSNNAVIDTFKDGGWWNQDTFDGEASATGTIVGQWTNATTGVYGLTKVSPADGDTVSRGIVACVLTDDPAAPKGGWRRRELTTSAANGYAEDPETWVWCRFKMVSTVPTAVKDYYTSPFGLARQAGAVTEPVQGMGLVYDRVSASWVWRAWRAGVAIDLSLGEPFDILAFHRVAAVHRGSSVEVFWDGESKGELVGAEIQPSLSVGPYMGHHAQITAALAFNPSVEIDLVGWGSPGEASP